MIQQSIKDNVISILCEYSTLVSEYSHSIEHSIMYLFGKSINSFSIEKTKYQIKDGLLTVIQPVNDFNNNFKYGSITPLSALEQDGYFPTIIYNHELWTPKDELLYSYEEDAYKVDIGSTETSILFFDYFKPEDSLSKLCYYFSDLITSLFIDSSFIKLQASVQVCQLLFNKSFKSIESCKEFINAEISYDINSNISILWKEEN